jgi:hypothetical protein
MGILRTCTECCFLAGKLIDPHPFAECVRAYRRRIASSVVRVALSSFERGASVMEESVDAPEQAALGRTETVG